MKNLMCRNLKDAMKVDVGDALPISSGHHYDNDEDYLKKKLKSIQKREEIRKQKVIDEYESHQKRKKSNKKHKYKSSSKKGGSQSSRDGSGELANTTLKEEMESGFLKEELEDIFDGWEFYKKKKVATTMIR